MTATTKKVRDGDTGAPFNTRWFDDGSGNLASGHVPLQGDALTPVDFATSAKQDSLATLIGTVGASPPSNTLLDRLKALLTGIVLAAGSNLIGKVGIDQTTPGTTNKVSIGTDGKVGLQVASADVSSSNPIYTAATQDAVAGDTGAGTTNSFMRYMRDKLFTGLPLGLGGTLVSASNRLPISQPDMLAVSGSQTSAAVLFSQDCTGYSAISVQVTNAGTSCTIVYETSDDNTTWYAVVGLSSNSGSQPSSFSTALQIAIFRVIGRYFRARVFTYGSGTVAVSGNLHKDPTMLNNRQTIDLPYSAGATAATVGSQVLALAKSSNPTAVTDGQAARTLATLLGSQVVQPYALPGSKWHSAEITLTASDLPLQAAGAAGVKNTTTWGYIKTDSSWTANVVQIRDGTTVLATIRLEAGVQEWKAPPGFELIGSAATALNIKLTGAPTGNCYATFGGHFAAD